MRTTGSSMPKNSSSQGPSAMEPSSSANPLTAALRASTVRSAADRFAVSPRKNGAPSSGLTIGKSPAKVSRNAPMTAFTVPAPSAADRWRLPLFSPTPRPRVHQYERQDLPHTGEHVGEASARKEIGRAHV